MVDSEGHWTRILFYSRCLTVQSLLPPTYLCKINKELAEFKQTQIMECSTNKPAFSLKCALSSKILRVTTNTRAFKLRIKALVITKIRTFSIPAIWSIMEVYTWVTNSKRKLKVRIFTRLFRANPWFQPLKLLKVLAICRLLKLIKHLLDNFLKLSRFMLLNYETNFLTLGGWTCQFEWTVLSKSHTFLRSYSSAYSFLETNLQIT